MKRSLPGAVFLATLFTAVCSAAPMTNAFFAMETAIHGRPDVVAQTLKELGYAGIGGGNYSSNLVQQLESRGLRFFNAYLTLSFAADQPALTPEMRRIIDGLAGHDSALWIAVSKVAVDGKAVPFSSSAGDEIAIAKLKEIADYAEPKRVRIALYPHSGSWLERCDDAVRLAQKMNRSSVGATFNLCHFLKVEGDIDPEPVLRRAAPHLFFASINGVDRGDTKKMNWDRLIQTLDKGTYDVRAFLEKLKAVGYSGPIGFQGYGIKGDEKENIARTMKAWRQLAH